MDKRSAYFGGQKGKLGLSEAGPTKGGVVTVRGTGRVALNEQPDPTQPAGAAPLRAPAEARTSQRTKGKGRGTGGGGGSGQGSTMCNGRRLHSQNRPACDCGPIARRPEGTSAPSLVTPRSCRATVHSKEKTPQVFGGCPSREAPDATWTARSRIWGVRAIQNHYHRRRRPAAARIWDGGACPLTPV
jgi:hypothetical protein